MEYDGLNLEGKQAYISSKAKNFVQNQAPCENMSRKARKGML